MNVLGCADNHDSTILSETTYDFNNTQEIYMDIWGLHICLKLEDMEFDGWNLSGCLDLIIGDSIDVPIGCRHI